jgi:hypothetical protein
MKVARSWLLVLVPAPAVLVTAIFCADTFSGGRLLWPASGVSFADAILLRNAGEVTHQLRNGVDPNAPSVLHDGSRYQRPRHVLPAEAAVRSGDARFLDLLTRHGARFDEPLLVRLYCEADRVGENDARSWVERRLGRPVDCNQ